MNLLKFKDGFNIVDGFGQPIGSVEVNQEWTDRSGEHTVKILSFNDAMEYFECEWWRNDSPNRKHASSIQDTVNFFANYKLVAASHANYKLQFKAAIEGSTLYRSPTFSMSEISRCECGGHKAGFKDHTRQHSSWCPVYKE